MSACCHFLAPLPQLLVQLQTPRPWGLYPTAALQDLLPDNVPKDIVSRTHEVEVARRRAADSKKP